MKLTVLGCLGAYPYHGQGTTSYLLQSEGFNLLLDAGSSTLVELEKEIDPLALDAVILTHYHHDHIADLGVLQYYWQLYPTQTPKPILPIYGHTEDAFHFNDLTMEGVTEGHAYFEAEELKLGPFLVTFMKTIHPVPCYAMRFIEEKTGAVFVFTGDSGYLESFNEFAKEADLFLADTYLFDGNERHRAHFTAGEAGTFAKNAAVKKLVLTHLPQQGDLAELRRQAVATSEGIPVELAAPHKTFEI
ncbi:MBL fold metallo-hydrolase [Enterococcus xiangfangensis]|uniref:MBL fold metallo-hydrolase n=1 Tax=Enterococcus xiangfangensis TaxID=1296537 RepID=UPI0010F65916|nr:MBL fold metallo-hydrolase [Enterococcus xiangfangensis]MBM7710737.1 ribonuclease BN (tRNA processing enzyme) [Enterococcus xiangfangensis]